MNKSKIGSLTAKGGFINEGDICEKFINYKSDSIAKQWLSTMGYDYGNIQNITAIQIPVRINCEKAKKLGVSEDKYNETIKYKKADIQVCIKIEIDNVTYFENISLKKANISAGFNQVDKRKVSTYKEMWKFSPNIEYWLKLFTGEILPNSFIHKKELLKIKDKKQRRLFFNEIPQKEFEEIKEFFEKNKTLIMNDILRGRGGLTAEWLLVTKKDTQQDNTLEWVLKDINTACNFFSQGNVEMTKRGSLKIGKVTMQRKGGTPDPTSLQFKINPLALFDLDNA